VKILQLEKSGRKRLILLFQSLEGSLDSETCGGFLICATRTVAVRRRYRTRLAVFVKPEHCMKRKILRRCVKSANTAERK